MKPSTTKPPKVVTVRYFDREAGTVVEWTEKGRLVEMPARKGK